MRARNWKGASCGAGESSRARSAGLVDIAGQTRQMHDLDVEAPRHGLRQVPQIAAGTIRGSSAAGGREQHAVGAVAVVRRHQRDAGPPRRAWIRLRARPAWRGERRPAAPGLVGAARRHRPMPLTHRPRSAPRARLGQHRRSRGLRQRRHACVRRHHDDAIDALDAATSAASTSSSMVSTSRCRASGGSTASRRCLARASAFTGTIAQVLSVAHGRWPCRAAAASRPQNARHCRARAILSSSVRIMVLVTMSGKRQCPSASAQSGLVDDEAVDESP